jgi:hypothetical protein
MLRFSRFAVTVTAALMFSLAAAQASPPMPSKGLTIDMPHGWWRIHIRPDGSGTLNFAALPQTGRFPAGTFDIAEVTGRLVACTEAGDVRPFLKE